MADVRNPADARRASELRGPSKRDLQKMGHSEKDPRSKSTIRTQSLQRRDARSKALDTKQELTDEKLKAGLSGLGKTADGLKQAYLTFTCNSTTIKDLSCIQKYQYLQRLQLGNNMLESVKHLSGKEHLVHLNVAGNKLTQLLDIPENRPGNLRYADYRMNQIKDFKDVASQLRSFTQLRDLYLDNNCLTSAKGLSSLTSLLRLSMSHNSLTCCDGLEQLTSLLHLELSFNAISSLQPLSALRRLRVLEVQDNHITALDGLETLQALNRVDASRNRIANLQNVCPAASCSLLGTLNLAGNPALSAVDYRLHVVYFLPQVNKLDQLLVDEKEKVHAKNLHGADADGLKEIRDRHFSTGELDDGGGAIPPIAAGLLACPGTSCPPGTSDPEDFAAVDAIADAIPLAVMQAGVFTCAGYLEARCKTQLQLARAIYRWIVRHVVFPLDGSWGQAVHARLFGNRPEATDLEEALLRRASGTWSERVAALFVALTKACHLEAVCVTGYWRHNDLWPGSSYQGHNHCWNAVKIDGKWRLVDCAASALGGGHVKFFNQPEHFRMTYLPLNAPWSLQRQYITNEGFWAQPWCHARLYNSGCRLLTADLHAVNSLLPAGGSGFLPARSLAVAVAQGYRIEQRLLDAQHKQLYPPVMVRWLPQPKKDGVGAPMFQQQVGAGKGLLDIETHAGTVQCSVTQLFVALPTYGQFYHEVILIKDIEGAVKVKLVDGTQMSLSTQDAHAVIRVRYDLGCPVQPPATTAEGPEKPESRPRLLPEMGPLWQELGAQLTSPEPTSQLEADRPQLFSVILPGALRARVITGDAHSPAALSKCRSVLRHAQPSGSAWLVDVALVRDSDMHEMAYDAARGEFSTEIILPRQDKLVVAAQMTAGGPWVGVLCFNINPEVQHIEDRPDLVVLAPAPHPRHPGMQLVRDIMRAVDTDKDGLLSKKEYLTKIRRDRKYADFLKMPVRIRESDGTLDKFNDIFQNINSSRTGFVTENELAEYLGVPSAFESTGTLSTRFNLPAEQSDKSIGV